jgi:hypothetical protein
MNLQASLARRLDESRTRPRLILRLQVVLQAPDLDAELAAGIRPSTSAAHQVRADHLMRLRVRRRIATALNRAVDDASRPVRHGTSQVPLCRDAVQHCSGKIRELATLVATMDNPRPRGVAIAFQLAFDGRGALFFQPDTHDGVEHLENTLHAAHRALRVSADL